MSNPVALRARCAAIPARRLVSGVAKLIPDRPQPRMALIMPSSMSSLRGSNPKSLRTASRMKSPSRRCKCARCEYNACAFVAVRVSWFGPSKSCFNTRTSSLTLCSHVVDVFIMRIRSVNVCSRIPWSVSRSTPSSPSSQPMSPLNSRSSAAMRSVRGILSSRMDFNPMAIIRSAFCFKTIGDDGETELP